MCLNIYNALERRIIFYNLAKVVLNMFFGKIIYSYKYSSHISRILNNSIWKGINTAVCYHIPTHIFNK